MLQSFSQMLQMIHRGHLVFCLLFAVLTTGTESSDSQVVNSLNRSGFPSGFVFGSATSSYQIEGAANEGGRGLSIWDTFIQKHPEKIKDRSSGAIAIDAYHRYKEDVGLMKDLGIDAYRFSISWSRILPKGKLSGGINQAGVEYYNNLINELLSKGIQPYVTLFHWDLPQSLEEEYLGFLSPLIIDDFRDYADLCFKLFGDRVKHWITLNEPWTYCAKGYSDGVFAPGRCSPWDAGHCAVGDSSREPYLAAHNQLLAHAAAVQVYRAQYQASQKGEIGITLNTAWFLPYNTRSKHDLDAVDRAMDFNLGWFMEPITDGDYPFNMRTIVGDRLPQFTSEQSEMLKGSFDFLGLNYYSSNYAKSISLFSKVNASYGNDIHVNETGYRDGKPIGPPAASEWLLVYPEGLLELLHYIKNKYNNPTIYITENGVDEVNNYGKEPIDALLKDGHRIDYYTQHLLRVQRAAAEGVNVRGFFAWSMFDNFEWADGYTVRFGLYFVDYKTLKRYPKDSALWFKKFLMKN